MPVFEDEHRTPRAGAQCPRRENLTMKGYVETREIKPDELLDTLIDVRCDVRGLAFNLHNMACYAGEGACIEGDTIDLLYASALLAYEALAQCVPLVEALLGQETTPPQLIARFPANAPPTSTARSEKRPRNAKPSQIREGFLRMGSRTRRGRGTGRRIDLRPLSGEMSGACPVLQLPCAAVPIRNFRRP